MNLESKATLHNGVKMPWVGLGVYKMKNDQEVVNAVKSALEIGYRSIDTAQFYDNEEGVGQAIKESGIPREEIFVTTKIWNTHQGYDLTLKTFEKSLEKLGMDYVDLYLVHWPVPGKYKETWKALEHLYEQKKVRAIGVSNFLIHHLEDLFQEAEIKPMVNQVEFHPQLFQKDLLNFCNEHQILLEAWSPLARGKYFGDPVLQELSQKYGKTPAQIMLRWDVQHGVVTIPKSTHVQRQKENADIFDFELTEEEMKALDGLNQDKRVGPHPDEFNYDV
ncbi:diketogulonate reductase-like aldo/keto reductase [Melghiribacillus thermohalophilus]|uniref:Diketogulonate reductase-like aldo/keto reductase n=1 Tax=Melghiribacillus thermohalophilus TaxID=1324956 RepID=A0A4R3MVW1_9BACI|nr:aldo/keto reductase [Melghiribacillus thermohalophilus]TCT18014.1 diketogulonate reductase-like aldo/keto reductase [Melghiribacillus thermohalophilus]